MSDSENVIAVKVLGQTYKVKCTPEQAQDLQASAALVDENMRKIKASTSGHQTDRMAIVAALNIANELITLKKQKNGYIDLMHDRIQKLHDRVKDALAEGETSEV